MTNVQYPIQNNRTLEVTVGLLVDAVNKHYDVDRVLADFGIKVLGKVNYTSEIPGFINPLEDPYTGNFGDAYLVSQNSDGKAPFDIYIWTRKTPDSEQGDGYWLDIGLLSTVGPQGPIGQTGPQGPQGESTRWYIFSTLPTSGNYKPGDVALLPNGNVYMYVSQDYGWSNATQVNIKGPSGSPGRNGQTPYIGPDGNWWVGIQSTGVRAQGRDGANGTPGTAILIQGKLSSIDLLPDASTAPRNYGYLINVGGVQRLYFIAGMEGEQNWQYIDYSGNGTIVTTNGVAQPQWDTNTKVDKTSGSYKIYGTDENGNQATFGWGFGASINQFVRRTVGGNIIVPTTTTSDEYATSKKYVDDGLAGKVNKINVANKVYGTDSTGETVAYGIDSIAKPNVVALRSSYGSLRVATPTDNADAATKKYVDDAVAAIGSDYVTKVVTIQGPYASPAEFSISDLPDIVPETPVTIVANMSHSGILYGPPPAYFDVGNYSISFANDWAVPNFNNNLTRYMCTIYQNGNVFMVNKQTDSDPFTVSGQTIRMGITDGNGGQCTLTVSYISYS